MQQFLVISDMHNRPECAPRFNFMHEHYPNHKLIVPGDIVNDGEFGQYKLVKAWLRYWEFSTVPGNHDVAHMGLFDFWHKLEKFDFMFRTDFSVSDLPNVSVMGNVVLIGLNSNPGSWGWWLDFARGKIGKRQLAYLRGNLRIWDDMVRIVYLHHHPLTRNISEKWFMGIKDKKALIDVVAGNCDALLFGHMHRQEHFTRFDIPIVYAAGAFYKETEALEITVQDDKTVEHRFVPII